jgi:hypothetical protein
LRTLPAASEAVLKSRGDRGLDASYDALRTVLEIEKQRTDEWKAVADRFALQAENLTTARPGRSSRAGDVLPH